MRSSSKQAGYSFLELVVTLVILALIIIGVLTLFDQSSRLARAQTEQAAMQQTMRVAQSELVKMASMAGAGGLPITALNPTVAFNYNTPGAFPLNGLAIAVTNNVPDDTLVLGGDTVLPGTDVLTLRGVFTTPVYHLAPVIDISSWVSVGTGQIENDHILEIPDKISIDVGQDLQPLIDRLGGGQREILILRAANNPDAYVLMEYDPSTPGDLVKQPCTTSGGDTDARLPECIRMRLRFSDAVYATQIGRMTQGSILRGGAAALNVAVPGIPGGVDIPTTISSIGLLEEFRYYVRADYEVPGDDSFALNPVLARGRFIPGTNVNLDRIDVADNVLDLQVAFGVDSDRLDQPGEGYPEHGTVAENPPDGTVTAPDEVLFNEVTDVAAGLINNTRNGLPWFSTDLQFHFVRISALAQVPRADNNYRAPEVAVIEDSDRGAPIVVAGKTYDFNDYDSNPATETRPFRRRWQRITVELRNLQ